MWNKTRRVGDKLLGRLGRFITPEMVRHEKTVETRPAPEVFRILSGHDKTEGAKWIAYMRKRGYETAITARMVRVDGFAYSVLILTARKITWRKDEAARKVAWRKDEARKLLDEMKSGDPN